MLPADQGRAGAEPPVEVVRPDAATPVVLVCEHASNRFPAEFGDLGIGPEVARSHVAWDPGARAVAVAVSEAMDAPLVASTVSRLVYDCNRPPDAPDAMPAESEIFEIPGNRNLDQAERNARIRSVYMPFKTALEAQIRRAAGARALVTIHSFTPVYRGETRRTEIGVLHDTDSRLADLLLASAARHTPRLVERNAPYAPADGVTHTLQQHALTAGLPNVMLEIRNDLIASPAQQQALAAMLTGWLAEALGQLGLQVNTNPKRGTGG